MQGDVIKRWCYSILNGSSSEVEICWIECTAFLHDSILTVRVQQLLARFSSPISGFINTYRKRNICSTEANISPFRQSTCNTWNIFRSCWLPSLTETQHLPSAIYVTCSLDSKLHCMHRLTRHIDQQSGVLQHAEIGGVFSLHLSFCYRPIVGQCTHSGTFIGTKIRFTLPVKRYLLTYLLCLALSIEMARVIWCCAELIVDLCN